jgi:hypothetical protein
VITALLVISFALCWVSILFVPEDNDPICGACAKTPGYRNGPASASEAACVRLQGEAREQLEALTAAKEHLELAELFLLDLCAKDIVPREVRSALDCLQRGLAAYTTTQGDDQ